MRISGGFDEEDNAAAAEVGPEVFADVDGTVENRHACLAGFDAVYSACPDGGHSLGTRKVVGIGPPGDLHHPAVVAPLQSSTRMSSHARSRPARKSRSRSRLFVIRSPSLKTGTTRERCGSIGGVTGWARWGLRRAV